MSLAGAHGLDAPAANPPDENEALTLQDQIRAEFAYERPL